MPDKALEWSLVLRKIFCMGKLFSSSRNNPLGEVREPEMPGRSREPDPRILRVGSLCNSELAF